MMLDVPEYIRTLVPYVPGKPIGETQREFKIKKVIKLASNENPLGPSLLAKKAISLHIKELHRYPDATGYHLKHALAKYVGVETNQIILGNGSNEVIDHIIRTYCIPGDLMVTQQASFIAYKICAQIHGVRTLEAPINQHLKFNVTELIDLVRKHERVKCVFIANPNNPTGAYLTKTEIDELVKGLSTIRDGSVLLVLDYAYWEYVTAKDLPDAVPYLRSYPNVVVLRTFSKVYGLAGLRVGYGVGSSEVISEIEKVRQPFNLNHLGLVAAQAALIDKAFVKRSRQVNQKGVAFWEKQLAWMGVPFWKSQGNFILANVQEGFGQSGLDLFNKCLIKGVIFRPVANYGLPHALRISFGTPLENAKAADVLRLEKKKTTRII